VLTHDEMEAVLHTLKQDLPVVDITVEFTLNRIVDQNTGFDVDVTAFAVPVSLECNWHSFPTVGVVVSETLSAA